MIVSSVVLRNWLQRGLKPLIRPLIPKTARKEVPEARTVLCPFMSVHVL